MLLQWVGQALITYIFCQLSFDTLHWVLHRCIRSHSKVLKKIGNLHQIHHDFYQKTLQLRSELCRANILYHHIPEYLVQISICALFLLLFSPVAVGAVALYYTVLFGFVLAAPLDNPHHLNQKYAKAPNNTFFDSPSYHAYHHLYPDSYFASGIRLFDMLWGTAAPIKGRTIAMTGTGGAFGKALMKILEKKGAKILPLKYGKDFEPGRYDMADKILSTADLLILTHGSMEEDMRESLLYSYIGLIERFRTLKAQSLVPPEIWAMGSEIEVHPAFGALMSRYKTTKLHFSACAKFYYNDDRTLYRHIVPAAFRTQLYRHRPVNADVIAHIALFFIRRGACYIPATYTGLAFMNYLRFKFWQKPTLPEAIR